MEINFETEVDWGESADDEMNVDEMIPTQEKMQRNENRQDRQQGPARTVHWGSTEECVDEEMNVSERTPTHEKMQRSEDRQD